MAKYKGTPLESDYEALQRRRAITKALLGQAVSPYEQQMVSGYAVPAWGEAIGKIAQGYAAGKFGKQADEEEKALSERHDEGTSAAMQKVIDTMTGRGAVGEMGPQQPIAADPKKAALMAASDPYLSSNKAVQSALINQTGFGSKASSRIIYDDEGKMYSYNIRTETTEPIIDPYTGVQMHDPRYTPDALRRQKYAEGAGAGEAKLVYQPLTDYQSRANELAAEMGQPPPFVYAGRQTATGGAPAQPSPQGEATPPVAPEPVPLPSKADVAGAIAQAEAEVAETSAGQIELVKALGKDEYDIFKEQGVEARDAVKLLRSNEEALKLLNEGMASGQFANFEVAIDRFFSELGFDSSDNVINAQAYSAAAANRVAAIIKAFGSGTGLSDADREYATDAAAGRITMDEPAIRKLIDINNRASKYAIKKYNEKATAIQEKYPDVVPWSLKVEHTPVFQSGGIQRPDGWSDEKWERFKKFQKEKQVQ